jgi:hypothetical protein
MGISLFDLQRDDVTFEVNFWHWRALVEAIRRLGVLPNETVDSLHAPFTGSGLSEGESRLVAEALQQLLLPTLAADERLLLDGRITTEPDDGMLYHGDEATRNYSTNRYVIDEFIAFLRQTSGFSVS